MKHTAVEQRLYSRSVAACSGGCHWDYHSGSMLSCWQETNPISKGGPAEAGPDYAKQTQFGAQSKRCETRPIPRQVLEGKGLMVHWSARRFRRNEPTSLRSNAQNKANLPGGAGQDGACRTRTPGSIVPNKPNFSGSRAGPPNLRRADCAKQSQTWAEWDIWGMGRHGEPVVRNKANLAASG
jgi:hypothetical protein